MKSILLIIIIGTTSFIYTDIESENILFSVLLPLIDFISLVAVAIWFVIFFHRQGISQTFDSNGGGDSGGFDGGGGDC